MALTVTHTNAGDDSAGKTWGIEGDNILILLLALVVSIGMALVLHRGGTGWVLGSILAGAPLLGAAWWVFGLRQGKPRGYDTDWLDNLLNGSGWQPNPKYDQ